MGTHPRGYPAEPCRVVDVLVAVGGERDDPHGDHFRSLAADGSDGGVEHELDGPVGRLLAADELLGEPASAGGNRRHRDESHRATTLFCDEEAAIIQAVEG